MTTKTLRSRPAASRRLTDPLLKSIEATALSAVREAGNILLRHFGRRSNPRLKENQSSVVCDADLAAEKYFLDRIRARYPCHNLISEENGREWQDSEFTWILDPLDGTSNFVAGIPWFGVQVAVLWETRPVVAAMYLPVQDTLYTATVGQGAWRDGKRVRVTTETDARHTLCAFGFDPTPGRSTSEKAALLFRISNAVRNTRATNSLVDFCYTIDGRFGACINLKTMVWDIAPVSLILPEAGGKFTLLDGGEIALNRGEDASKSEYAVLGASPRLHARMLAVASRSTR